MKPLISIIMPVYNAEKYLAEAVESILKQSYVNWELLICDDSSTDNSLEIINSLRDERLRIFNNSTNIGYLKTCNLLFAEAKGEYITWQDADDLSHPDRVLKQVKTFQTITNLTLCGTRALYFEKNINKPQRFKNVKLDYDSILLELLNSNQFCGASVMVRKQTLLDFGGYREYFNRIGNEDYDVFSRITEKNKAINLQEVLYYVRLSSNSISRTIRDPRQLISGQIVRFLASQRSLNNGQDSLTGLDFEILKKVEYELLLPYVLDPSKAKRDEADQYAYNGMKKNAFLSSLNAFLIRPSIKNVKYIVVCFLRLLS